MRLLALQHVQHEVCERAPLQVGLWRHEQDKVVAWVLGEAGGVELPTRPMQRALTGPDNARERPRVSKAVELLGVDIRELAGVQS
jgi:hypothetical protein